jgi:hypothetical protein
MGWDVVAGEVVSRNRTWKARCEESLKEQKRLNAKKKIDHLGGSTIFGGFEPNHKFFQ